MASDLLLLLMVTIAAFTTLSQGHLHVTILQTSDISSRFEQVNNEGTECTDAEIREGRCYGGLARLATRIEEVRSERKGNIHTLLVDTGDMLIGEFFNIYRGNVTADLMNRMGYDAMAIGNNELAIGPDALVPFLEMANFSVVSANLDASLEPNLDGKFTKSAVKTYLNPDGSEEYLGIVGYTTEVVADIANVENVVVNDVIEAVQAEVDALTSQGIEHILVLGHSWGPGDISTDLEIAQTVRGVDIVVGGGVNYFQYQGCPPDVDVAYDDYPIVVTPDDNPNGKVLVMHNTIWGKYLGRINVMFNHGGNISEWYGNPILMDNKTAEDPDILAEIMSVNEGVSNASNRIVGRTHVFLEGYPRYSCRAAECNMGNMITDAMRWTWISLFDESMILDDVDSWSDVSFAVFNSGGIRDSLDQGNIRYRDIVDVLPFSNTFDCIELRGVYVREMLEQSAAGYNDSGAFLQVSGMRVTYDISKEPGNRVVEVNVLCTECDFPEFVPLENDTNYRIVVPSFMADGYDGYDVIAENGQNRITGEDYVTVMEEYIAKFSPIITGLQDRITIIDPVVEPTPSANMTTEAMTTDGASSTAPTTDGASTDAMTTTAAATTTSRLTTFLTEAATVASTTEASGGGGGGGGGDRPDKPRKQ